MWVRIFAGDSDHHVAPSFPTVPSIARDYRLQLGGGVNLMAADNSAGRYYSFVGSDLIALLNAAGPGTKP